jgi:hypothetical protein
MVEETDGYNLIVATVRLQFADDDILNPVAHFSQGSIL